jgi:hypothetical protein
MASIYVPSKFEVMFAKLFDETDTTSNPVLDRIAEVAVPRG